MIIPKNISIITIAAAISLTACSKPKQSFYELAESNSKPEKTVVNDDWHYSSAKDEMRGTSIFSAKKTSENSVTLNAPYEGGKLTLYVRKDISKNGRENSVYFSIPSGQIICNDGCLVPIKIDEEELQLYKMVEPNDYSSDILFMSNTNDIEQFINKIKKSKKLIIELNFYQSGNHQFKFNTTNLKL